MVVLVRHKSKALAWVKQNPEESLESFLKLPEMWVVVWTKNGNKGYSKAKDSYAVTNDHPERNELLALRHVRTYENESSSTMKCAS